MASASTAPQAAAREDEDEEEGEEEEDEQTTAAGRRPQRPQAAATMAAEDNKPSELLKLLRGAPPPRPLFLAAPGVANAQSAYYAFSQFLAWSDQPIYVLEKDNDLNIFDLARQNARDIVQVQPEGPYLLGGHSYGGAVAIEVAAVLESWGHDVGLVLVSAGHESVCHTTVCSFTWIVDYICNVAGFALVPGAFQNAEAGLQYEGLVAADSVYHAWPHGAGHGHT